MSTLARTESSEQRAAIYAALGLRNRLVAILRVGVPAIGAILFLALALQLYIANVASSFGISGIRIDRNNLVVETPSYAATGSNGTLYTMAASEARAAFDKPDQIILSGVRIDMAPAKAPAIHIGAGEAALSTSTQTIEVPAEASVTADDGLSGTLTGLVADFGNKTTTGGALAITFHNGATLKANSMAYDSRAGTWTLTGVEMTVPDLPEAAP